MKMKFGIKKAVIVGIIVVAAGGGYWRMRSQAANNAQMGISVTTMPLEQKSIEESITLKAPLEGTESAEIVSKLHYEVIQLNVQEGDKVKKGQILAVLNADQLKKDIRKMESEIALNVTQNEEASVRESQQAELAQLELTEKLKDQQELYDKALMTLDIKKRDLDNIRILAAAGVETQENLRIAQDAYNDAKKEVDGFNVVDGKVVANAAEEKSVESAAISSRASREKSISILQQDLARKREELDDCQIKSPIDGTVTRVNIKLGRFADETDNDKPMFVVENIDKLQMKVLVSEYDIGRIQVGQSVSISADILNDDTVGGQVSRLSPTGEQKDGTSERVIPTFIDVAEETKGLIAGINAKAKILIAQADNVMVVPFESLVENPDGTQRVLRVNSENKVEVIPVETGVSSDLEIQIMSDQLAVGDQIIISPTPDLVEGTVVMPQGLMGEPVGSEGATDE